MPPKMLWGLGINTVSQEFKVQFQSLNRHTSKATMIIVTKAFRHVFITGSFSQAQGNHRQQEPKHIKTASLTEESDRTSVLLLHGKSKFV